MIKITKQKSSQRFLLHHGPFQIPFNIDFCERRQLTIHVHPEQRLEVLAPHGRSVDKVLDKVEKRATWIAKQWKFFGQYLPGRTPRCYVSGETFWYLGRQYRLKVLQSKEQTTKLRGSYLEVRLPEKTNTDAIKQQVASWYKEHATYFFKTRLESCLERCKPLKIKSPPKLNIRQMKKRWGSCTSSGTISLNSELIEVPSHCIDYVIVHELCHLKICNHTPQFFHLLSQCMPDWRVRKKRLDSFHMN